MAEEGQGFLTTLQRQFMRTHRPFRSVVMDREGVPVLFVSSLRRARGSKMLIALSRRSDDHLRSSTVVYSFTESKVLASMTSWWGRLNSKTDRLRVAGVKAQ